MLVVFHTVTQDQIVHAAANINRIYLNITQVPNRFLNVLKLSIQHQ